MKIKIDTSTKERRIIISYKGKAFKRGNMSGHGVGSGLAHKTGKHYGLGRVNGQAHLNRKIEEKQ